MKVLRACVVTAIVTTTLSLAASIALFGEDNNARETRDRHEIEALMWKYTRALDKGDGATYAATYTVDGQFGTGANATIGTASSSTTSASASSPSGVAPFGELAWMYSARIPSSTVSSPDVATSAGAASSWSPMATRVSLAPSRTEARKKFIGGLPIKLPTNSVAG